VRLQASHLGRHSAAAAAAILLAAGLAGRGLAFAPPDARPTTARPFKAGWWALPLAEVAAQATRFSGMPFVVDRRIDPTTPITLEAAGEPPDTVAAAIAAAADTDVALLDSMVRIAPPAVAAACEAAERARDAELRRLPASQHRIVEKAAGWTWEAGAEPRELVAAAARQAGVELEGLEEIPHDHFPAASLPALSLADRLDLVLAHFDRRVAWSAGLANGTPRGRVVPLPSAPADAARNRPRQPAGPRRPAVPVDAFTLRVAAPLDELLAVVGKRLGLTIDLDAASLRDRGITPREIVKLSVADVPRDRLLDAITEPLGLAWKIEGDRLQVWARPAQ
jgi:hypothetical protein